MLILYNPHVDDMVAEPPHFRLIRRRALKKYGFLLPGLLAEPGGWVNIYVDATISAFLPERLFSSLPAFLRRFISALEVWAWIRINGLRGHVRRISGTDAVGGSTLLMFSYKAALGRFDRRLAGLSRFRVVVAHLSHYFISTREKSANLRRLSNVVLAGDVDVAGNAYFQRFFPWYRRPVMLFPFAVAARFAAVRSLSERQPKAVATGTFHDLREEMPAERYRDFIEFFRSSTYHPIRKLIYDRRDGLKQRITCHISLFRPDNSRGALFRQFLRRFAVSQKAYFTLDIVAIYNQHRWAIVGEEASGFPALGAFEAMACGCVLIGQPQFYLGLGLKPDIHFFPHDGTLQSIVDAMNVLDADPERAEAIAAAGRNFVERELRGDAVFRALQERVTVLTEPKS